MKIKIKNHAKWTGNNIQQYLISRDDQLKQNRFEIKFSVEFSKHCDDNFILRQVRTEKRTVLNRY